MFGHEVGLAVGVRVHPKGVGWGRGAGLRAGRSRSSTTNWEQLFWMLLALCTGQSHDETKESLLPQSWNRLMFKISLVRCSIKIIIILSIT